MSRPAAEGQRTSGEIGDGKLEVFGSEHRLSCLRPRQRILCLHSFRTSGAILKQQLFLFSNLGTILSDYCDLDYIDAPHRCSPADDEKQEPLISQVFEGPYHEWFNANRRMMTEGGGLEYSYLEESLSAVADAVKRRGPYDGFVGFSQGRHASCNLIPDQSLTQTSIPEPRSGATLAHLCAMLASNAQLPFEPPQFLLLICSRASRHYTHQARPPPPLNKHSHHACCRDQQARCRLDL